MALKGHQGAIFSRDAPYRFVELHSAYWRAYGKANKVLLDDEIWFEEALIDSGNTSFRHLDAPGRSRAKIVPSQLIAKLDKKSSPVHTRVRFPLVVPVRFPFLRSVA
jgi:hypothetical protein